MISNFSLRQRLHLLLELLYGECDARMRQEIKCSMLLSLRVQICLLSSVEFLCLAWRNDAVWFLYLVLKSFSVSPMYFYNPPFSKNTSTNIGHKFLALVDKHFPNDHKLRKIFNRNTIKISYSCMNNTKQIIDNDNKRITLKWTKERRIRRDNFDATVKQFYVHAIKKLVLAKYVKRERSH